MVTAELIASRPAGVWRHCAVEGLRFSLRPDSNSNRERHMTIGIIATLKIQDGKEPAFEAVFGELAAAVHANEPGNKLYQLFKSRKDKNTYVVMEMYESEEALKAHGKTDHYRTIGARLGPSMAGAPDIQYLDSV
jgi:quinol monooxygenase YgiN